MLFFRVHKYFIVLTKMKAMSLLPLLAFRRDVVKTVFLKNPREGRLSSSQVGCRNIPSDVCYDDTKHCWAQSEHRRIQKPLKHLRWNVIAKTVNGLKRF